MQTRRSRTKTRLYLLSLYAMACLAPMTGDAQAAEKLADSLVGYWTFDEPDGPSALDYSEAGRCKGRLKGGVERVEGRLGKALHFNGTGAWVDIPDGPWNLDTPYTISFWIKFDADRADGVIIEHLCGGVIAGVIKFTAREAGFRDGRREPAGASFPGGPNLVRNKWLHRVAVVSEKEIRTYQDGKLVDSKPLAAGWKRLPGRLALGANGTTGTEFFTGSLDEVGFFNRALSDTEVAEIYAGYAVGKGLAGSSGVRVVDWTTDRVRYRPGEAGTATGYVRNFSDSPQDLTVETDIIGEIARSVPVAKQTLALPAYGVGALRVPFTAPAHEYGAAIRVRLIQGDGREAAAAKEMFGVADNVWKIAIGADIAPMKATGSMPNLNPEDPVQAARAQYFNWWEKSYWAPCDWGDLVPTGDRWRGGEGGCLEIGKVIKDFIVLAKSNGISSITYGKSTACGPAGYEILRRHPEWFKQSAFGQPFGIFNTAFFPIERWDNNPRSEGQWFYVYPSLYRAEVLDWGIDQLSLSAGEYGWDGVRFDGDYTWVSSPELAASNQRRMKERIWKKFPQYVFGYNEGYGPPEGDPATWPHGLRESLAGGGHYMNEAIGSNWLKSPSTRYQSYEDYWRKVGREVDALRTLGASYHFIFGLRKMNVSAIYKFVLGTADGVHPVYGDTAIVPGCANWGRFLTRWSAFVWDTNLRNRPDADAEVKSAVPLWHAVKDRVADEQTRMTVVHLIVPPSTDQVVAADVKIGAPARDVAVRVKLPADARVACAAVIAPEHPDEPVVLPVKRDGAWAEVTVPEVSLWSMVVFECPGAFTLPRYEKFTEPPDEAAVKAAIAKPGVQLNNDPLKADKQESNPERQTLSIVNVYAACDQGKAVKDPAARNGECLRMEGAAGITHSEFKGLAPGRFRVTYRMKLSSDKDGEGKPVEGLIRGWMPVRGTSYIDLVKWKLSDFKSPGQYEDMSGEFDFVGDSNQVLPLMDYKGNGVVYYDTVSIERIKAYTDAEVSAKEQALKARGARVKVNDENAYDLQSSAADLMKKRGPGRKILVVNGLYYELYRIPEALALLGKVTDITPAPKKPEAPSLQDLDKAELKPAETKAPDASAVQFCQVYVDLAEDRTTLTGYPTTLEALCGYDAVVLMNVSATWLSVQGRKDLLDFVQAGGGLLVLGGNYSLGQGHFKGTFMEDIMPVTVEAAKDLEQLPSMAPLAPARWLARALPAKTGNDVGGLCWLHRVTPKPGAEPLLTAGDRPVLTSWSCGKGRSAVFSGTVLGESTGNGQPFWESKAWPQVMAQVVDWLAGKDTAAMKGSVR